jgi:hypothetical protein
LGIVVRISSDQPEPPQDFCDRLREILPAEVISF